MLNTPFLLRNSFLTDCAFQRSADPNGQTRLKDLVTLEGMRDNQLVGYGLVVGLAGTGDKHTTVFSTQSLANMLQRMGVTVTPTQSASRIPRR